MDLVSIATAAAVIVLFVLRQRDRADLDQVLARIRAFDQAKAATSPAAAVAAPPAPPAPAYRPPTSAATPTAPRASEPVAASSFAEVDEPAPRGRSTLERLIAEHALALVGGLFVLVAAVLFVGFAIEQGWIGPWAKFALALALAAGLVAASLRVASRLPLDEQRGRAIGSLHGVLAATGVGVAFIAIVAAVRVQELFAAGLGALLEVAVAVGAVQLARRWRSQDLAAFGMGVGLAAPMLVGAEATGATVVLLAVTLVAATVLAVLERWPRLLLGASLVTAPQLASYAIGATLAGAVPVVFGWWAVLVAGCVATARRDALGANRSVVSTVFVIALGAAAFLREPTAAAADQWAFATFLFVLAALNVAIGAVLLRDGDRSVVLATAFITAGAAAAATGLADATDGAGRVAGWSAEIVALTLLWWRVRGTLTAVFAAGLAALALLHVLAIDAPPELLLDAGDSLTRPLLAIGSLVAAAFAIRFLQRRAGAVAGEVETMLRRITEAVGVIGVWYGVAILLVHVVASSGGTESAAQLVLAAWAATGALLAAALLLTTIRIEVVVVAGAFVLLELVLLTATEHDIAAILLAAGAALVAVGMTFQRRTEPMALALVGMGAIQAAILALLVLTRVPPQNLRIWSAYPTAEALAMVALLAAVLVLLAVAVRRWEHADLAARRATGIAAALGALYAISVSVVALFSNAVGVLEQDAQVALTLTWIALGVAALFAGTSPKLRQHVELRVGAYALLGLGAAKLVLADTVELETPMRVLAFLATGLALLGSAALEQRMRAADPPT